MRAGKGQDDVVFGRRRLQFEIELAAEALAQGEAQARLILLPNGEWMTNSFRSGKAVSVSPELGPLKRQAERTVAFEPR